MSNNQQPPQLPPEAPRQIPPQQPQYQQPQYAQNQNWNNPIPPKKGLSTGAKIGIGIAAFFVFCVIMSLIFGDKDSLKNAANGKNDETTAKWEKIAIEDSTKLENGYFSISNMQNANDFNKKFIELQALGFKHTPKEVTDSSIITFVNRNAFKAQNMFDDSLTIYRNQFTKILENDFWEDNIKIKTQNGGKVIWFIGGLFANNKNIKDFQEKMGPKLKELGYTRACYKWADISSAEYTYYDLDK